MTDNLFQFLCVGGALFCWAWAATMRGPRAVPQLALVFAGTALLFFAMVWFVFDGITGV